MKRASKSGAREALAEQRRLLSGWKETLADLTPGLAHDLNNTLTGILAVSEVFLGQIDSKHVFHEGLSLIKQNAQQASQLLHRVARLHLDKTGVRAYHDLNSTATEVAEILSRLIPKRIELSTKVAGESLPVYLDAVEFRRMLLRLALSLLHTTPGPGKLLFQTSRPKALSRSGRFRGELPCLPAVCLSIVGSGVCFEAEQSNSGLSLEHAEIFVRKNGGAVSLDSVSRGVTAYRIWLPESNFTEGETAETMHGVK